MKKLIILLFSMLLATSLVVSSPLITTAQSGNSTCIYTLLITNSKPIIMPGDSVDITGFLSGYGTPEQNKLTLTYSSPNLLDKANAGTIRLGELPPIGIDSIGFTQYIPPIIFRDAPTNANNISFALPVVMTERSLTTDGKTYSTPLALHLNTSRHVPSGDYKIDFVFTYRDSQGLKQDHQQVSFHVLSPWERWQGTVAYIGLGIAVLSLFVTALPNYKVLFSTVFRLGRNVKNAPYNPKQPKHKK